MLKKTTRLKSRELCSSFEKRFQFSHVHSTGDSIDTTCFSFKIWPQSETVKRGGIRERNIVSIVSTASAPDMYLLVS